MKSPKSTNLLADNNAGFTFPLLLFVLYSANIIYFHNHLFKSYNLVTVLHIVALNVIRSVCVYMYLHYCC